MSSHGRAWRQRILSSKICNVPWINHESEGKKAMGISRLRISPQFLSRLPQRLWAQLCFELSIHFPVFFFRELFLVAVHDWFAIQTNVWKIQNTTGRFLAQLHPSNFFSFNPFPSAKSFQFMNFSEAMFYENY